MENVAEVKQVYIFFLFLNVNYIFNNHFILIANKYIF